jgi:hypothetical protein
MTRHWRRDIESGRPDTVRERSTPHLAVFGAINNALPQFGTTYHE